MRHTDSEDPDSVALWEVVVWYISAAHIALGATPGTYFRGCRGLFNYTSPATYAVGQRVLWTSFSSSTSDLRIAGKFLYQAAEPEHVDGVIFKIHGKTPVPIEWCSFVPEEREYLFLPDTHVEITNWYSATDVNLQPDMADASPGAAGGAREQIGIDVDAFRLKSAHLAQPVPLPRVGSEQELKALFEEQKGVVNNRVIVIEMAEITHRAPDVAGGTGA